MKRQRIAESDLNVRPDQKLSVVASGLAALAALGAWRAPWLLVLAACGPIAVVALNAPFYRFLVRKRGVVFAAASVPLHLVYFGCCGLSVLIALAFWQLAPSASRGLAPVAAGSNVRRDPAEVAGQGGGASRPSTRRPHRWTRR